MLFVLMANKEVNENVKQLCRNDDKIYIRQYLQIRKVSVGAADVKNKCKYFKKVNCLLCLSCFINYNFFWSTLLNLYKDFELVFTLTLSLMDYVYSFVSFVAIFSKILLKLIALWTLLWNWSTILFFVSLEVVYFSFKNFLTREFSFLLKSLNLPY